MSYMKIKRSPLQIYDGKEIQQTHNPIFGSYYRRFNPYARLYPKSVGVKVVSVEEPTMHDINESPDLMNLGYGMAKEVRSLFGYDIRYDGKRHQNPHMNPLWAVEFEPTVTIIGSVSTGDDDMIAVVLAEGLLSSPDRKSVIAYRRRDGRYIGHGHSLAEALEH